VSRALVLGLLIATLPAAPAAAKGGPSPAATRYEVRLEVDTRSGTLAAETVVRLAPAEVRPEQRFQLGSAYEVDRLWAEGGQIELIRKGGRYQEVVVRDDPAPGPVRFGLSYAGTLLPTGTPPLNVISPDLVELNLDSAWIPVRSDFTLNFSSELTIAGLPRDAVVVSQGRVARWGETISVTRDVADFDLAFAAAPGLKRVRSAGLEFYGREPDGPVERTYRRHATRSLRFLERWFGRTPGRPVRVVLVDRERTSGYARRGYVVVTRGREGAEPGIAKFVAHEFAHAWSPRADPMSENHWLVESVTEYVALRYIEAELGIAARDDMLRTKALSAADAPPVLGGGRRRDAVLYDKGCLLLFDLERRIGRTRMDALLVRTTRRQAATTAAFLEMLKQTEGAETAAWFEDTLRR